MLFRLSKLLNSQIGKGNGKTYADIIKEMMDADKFKEKYKSALHERAMAFNTKTGYHTNSQVFDDSRHVNGELFNAIVTSAEEEVNAMMHSHPEKKASMSIGQIDKVTGKISGDIIAFYWNVLEGIEKELIVAQDEVQVFDAKKFYEKYNDIFKVLTGPEHDPAAAEELKNSLVEVHRLLCQKVHSDVDDYIIPFIESSSFDSNDLKKMLPGTGFTSKDANMRNMVTDFSKGDLKDRFENYVRDNKEKIEEKQWSTAESFIAFVGNTILESDFADKGLAKSDISSYLRSLRASIISNTDFQDKTKNIRNELYQQVSNKHKGWAFKEYDRLNPKKALGIDDFDEYIETIPIDEFVFIDNNTDEIIKCKILNLN